MNKKQVLEVIRIIENTYNQPFTRKRNMFTEGKSDNQIILDVVDQWHQFLKDSNPTVVLRNLEQHILKEKFPPTIAELAEYRNTTNIPDVNETQELFRKMKQWEQEAGRP